MHEDTVPESNEAGLPPEEGQRAAREEWEPRALKLHPSVVKTLNADTDLAYFNANNNAKAFAPHEAVIRTLPDVDADLVLGAGRIALALVFVASMTRRYQPPPAGHAEALARGRKLRALFLYQHKAAAVDELIPEEEVDEIIEGKGSLNHIQDLADFAAQHRKYYDVLKGKTLITPELLVEAEQLSVSLRDFVRPAEAGRPETPEEFLALADLRDRLWTLLQLAHTEGERVAPILRLAIKSLQARRPPPVTKKAVETPAA